MESIAISEFKVTCLRVIDQVNKTGHSVIITKRGVPMALISPPQKTSSWLGLARDSVQIVGDIVSPVVPEDEWEVLQK